MPPKIKKRKATSPHPDTSHRPKRSSNMGERGTEKEKMECHDCGEFYSSIPAHQAVCGRKETTCVYPDPNSANGSCIIVLPRVGRYFRCIRCGKQLKKDQGMKAHARKCYGPSNPVEGKTKTCVAPSQVPHNDATLSGIEKEQPFAPNNSVEQDNLGTLVITSTISPSGSEEHSPNISAASQVKAPRPNPEGNIPRASTWGGRRVASNAPFGHLNKYEQMVVLDESSVVDDPLLRCTPHIVNVTYKGLICTTCRHGINLKRALDHLREFHSQCKVGTAFQTELDIKYPELVAELVHPPEIIDPIFGLAIPIEEYTICVCCYRGYVNLASWPSHVCEKADISVDGIGHFSSHVQSFFRGRRVCYFPVKVPVSALGEVAGDDFDLFKSTFHGFGISEDEVLEPEDYRELDRFLLKEGWINHVSGFSKSELSLLVAPPKANDILKNIEHEVIALMTNIQSTIGMAGYHIRRLLGRRPADNSDGLRTIPHRDVQEETLKKYGLIVTCLICFVFRCFKGWECQYSMKLTAPQEEACRLLGTVVSQAGAGDSTEDLWSLLESDLHAESDNGAGNFSDGEYEDLLGEEGEEITETQPCIVQNSTQHYILDLLVPLFTHLPSGNDDKFYTPISRFPVLFSLKGNGQWLPGRRITQVFAAMLFCGREVMMALMFNEITRSPGLRYSQAYHTVSSFINDSQEGPIPTMYLLMRYLSRFAAAEEGTIHFSALDFSGDNIIIMGQALYLRDIRFFVERIIEEVKELLRNRLFFGLDIFDLDWSPGVVNEQPRNRSIGYSCFQDPANSFHNHRFDLLRVK